MSANVEGRRFRVPRSRRLTSDLLWFHQAVPLCGHDRQCDLSTVTAARCASETRVSWSALFLKAMALVANDYPALRQTWYRWPFPHLYQHPVSVATTTVHRDWQGEPWLFWGQIRQPEHLSLTDIQQQLDRFTSEPVPSVFRRQVKLAALPLLLRRLIWWWNLNIATDRRATRLGTFFQSTLSGRGAEIQVPPSIHTGCLTYGPVDDTGCCRVTLAYDHRVMDGVMVADILSQLEQTLNEQLTQELRQPVGVSRDEQAA